MKYYPIFEHRMYVLWGIPSTQRCFVMSLKLKTINKCFFCPYKRELSMLCFIAFNISRIPEDTMQVKRDIHIGQTQTTQNLLRIHVFVLSLHINLFSNCYKNSTICTYITFYLRCRCATVLGAEKILL